jgi:hypothetical protein
MEVVANDAGVEELVNVGEFRLTPGGAIAQLCTVSEHFFTHGCLCDLTDGADSCDCPTDENESFNNAL